MFDVCTRREDPADPVITRLHLAVHGKPFDTVDTTGGVHADHVTDMYVGDDGLVVGQVSALPGGADKVTRAPGSMPSHTFPSHRALGLRQQLRLHLQRRQLRRRLEGADARTQGQDDGRPTRRLSHTCPPISSNRRIKHAVGQGERDPRLPDKRVFPTPPLPILQPD